MANVLNVNIGVLGHVDSGKTSLAKTLSTVASTASFDKSAESKERGITLDLGFSSLQLDMPEHLAELPYDKLQFTLVDCPGHASLIRTIIGGAQIIDTMMLVIDITKGIQTQTAECIVIGEITTKSLVVVLNKIDMIPPDLREKKIAKTKAALTKVFAKTKFKDPKMVAISARPGGPESADDAIGVDELIDTLKALTAEPKRDVDGPFLYAVDHCFSIKGQGTIVTGTCLNGTIRVNDDVELPAQQVVKKVKSMQQFRKPCTQASMGDRVGICLTQLDAKTLERGILCTPGSLPTMIMAVCNVEKIRFFKSQCKSKTRFHLSVGHDTVMCTATFFGTDQSAEFSLENEYHYQEELLTEAEVNGGGGDSAKAVERYKHQFVLLEFDSKVSCRADSLVIGSRLDSDIHQATCRLAFAGRMQMHSNDAKYKDDLLPSIKVFKMKVRSGVADMMHDESTVIGRTLFSKETALEKFINLKVRLSTGEHGFIEAGFGKSGKFKVRIPDGLKAETMAMLKQKGDKGKKKEGAAPAPAQGQGVEIILEFKRFIFDPAKALTQ